MTEDMNQIQVNPFKIGDIVVGQVTKVEDKQVYVNIPNSKVDGIVPISELSNIHVEKASDVVTKGVELTLKVIKIEEDALILSKRRIDAEKAWEKLYQSFESGERVHALITEVVKGGLVADVGVRGFIPASMVSDEYIDDFSDYVGKSLDFKIIELDKEKNRVILSHKAVLEEEKREKKKNKLSAIKPGDVLEGKVQRITNFGAFVDIGGIDGLVHISQLSHNHVDHPSEVVNVGDPVQVKVLSVDRDNERVALSIKEMVPGPWEGVENNVQKGAILEGKVTKIVSYGAFVEVLPQVEGLVHISQISTKHIKTPHEVLKEGDIVQVKVLDVNEKEKRLSLSIKELEESDEVIDYELPEETKGFQLSEIIGEKLKQLKSES
jgi:small subunit ribosomal protein S1